MLSYAFFIPDVGVESSEGTRNVFFFAHIKLVVNLSASISKSTGHGPKKVLDINPTQSAKLIILENCVKS